MKRPSTDRLGEKSNRSTVTCSTCGRSFIFAQSKTPPFCSERCQMVDLGRWLKEEISIPFEGEAGNVPVEYRDDDDDEGDDTFTTDPRKTIL